MDGVFEFSVQAVFWWIVSVLVVGVGINVFSHYFIGFFDRNLQSYMAKRERANRIKFARLRIALSLMQRSPEVAVMAIWVWMLSCVTIIVAAAGGRACFLVAWPRVVVPFMESGSIEMDLWKVVALLLILMLCVLYVFVSMVVNVWLATSLLFASLKVWRQICRSAMQAVEEKL
jgi:hypothetical protein